MKIMIDGRMLSWTGIGRVTQKLLDELPELDQTDQFVVMLLKADFIRWEPPASNFTKMLVDIPPYSLDSLAKLGRLIDQSQADLVHFLHFNVPLGLRTPYVVTINDLTLIDFPTEQGSTMRRWLYRGKDRAMRLAMRQAVKKATAIITLSQFVKQQLIERYHISGQNIFVTWLGVDHVNSPVLNSPSAAPRLLYVGNPYPHKNLGRLLEAFVQLKSTRPDLRLTIVSNVNVGNTRQFYERLQDQARQLGVAAAVDFPGYVDDQTLNELYATASVFVFPSLSEGFGLPPLEAMAHGTPVACSKAASLPEVCGPAAVYFDPTDVDDLAAVTGRLLDDSGQQQQLRQAGPKQAAKFRWSDTAQATLDVYQRATRK